MKETTLEDPDRYPDFTDDPQSVPSKLKSCNLDDPINASILFVVVVGFS